ncbi:MAG: DUF167 domain-containing protein [bacterium]
MSWITDSKSGVIIQVHASPRASKTQIQGLHGDAVKIRLQAPPVDGKANETLIEFLAKTLGIPQRQITLISGQTSRQKRLNLQGITANQVGISLGINIA